MDEPDVILLISLAIFPIPPGIPGIFGRPGIWGKPGIWGIPGILGRPGIWGKPGILGRLGIPPLPFPLLGLFVGGGNPLINNLRIWLLPESATRA